MKINLNKKNIILVGGGGFGLEVCSYLQDHLGTEIFGVIDEDEKCETIQHFPEVRYLGKSREYKVSSQDVGIICIGNTFKRMHAYDEVRNINLPLFSFIHPTSYVSKEATIGEGVFIAPHCIVSANATIGDNVALNVYSGVGHGAKIHSHCMMSPYSVANGDCEINEGVFLGSRVTLFPKIKVGRYASIDAGCVIRKDIDEFALVSQRVEQKSTENRILKKQFED